MTYFIAVGIPALLVFGLGPLIADWIDRPRRR